LLLALGNEVFSDISWPSSQNQIKGRRPNPASAIAAGALAKKKDGTRVQDY